MLDALALERLRSDDPAKFKLGIQCLPADGLAHEEGMAAATRALAHPDADVRFLAAYQFARVAGRDEIDITLALPALERLFDDDQVPPMHADKRDNRWFTASAKAIGAVARFHARREDQGALRSMIAQPGFRGIVALDGVSSAPDPTVYFDVLQRAMTEGEPKPPARSLGRLGRHAAATAVAAMRWGKRDWGTLEELFTHPDEIVRLAAFEVVDSAAAKDEDMGGILPAVLRTFERQEPELSETRRAAARVLLWRVFKEKRPRVVWVNGVDILKIPEVIEERKTFRRFAKEIARNK